MQVPFFLVVGATTGKFFFFLFFILISLNNLFTPLSQLASGRAIVKFDMESDSLCILQYFFFTHHHRHNHQSSSILCSPQIAPHKVPIFTTLHPQITPQNSTLRKCQNLRKKTLISLQRGSQHQRNLVVVPWILIWTWKVHGPWITCPLSPTPCHLLCSPPSLTNLPLLSGSSLMEKMPGLQLQLSLIATRSSLVCFGSFQIGFLLT